MVKPGPLGARAPKREKTMTDTNTNSGAVPTDQSEVEAVLTPAQVAKILAITPKQLEAMRGAGTGPAYGRFGHKTIRYTCADVKQFIAASRRTSTAARRP